MKSMKLPCKHHKNDVEDARDQIKLNNFSKRLNTGPPGEED